MRQDTNAPTNFSTFPLFNFSTKKILDFIYSSFE
jgi:hypothetical protein